jgi:hypothetical protein
LCLVQKPDFRPLEIADNLSARADLAAGILFVALIVFPWWLALTRAG